MKKSLVLAMAMALGVTASAYAANPFSDVPAGHWAYDSLAKLADTGVIDGYPDGTFKGDETITRYEAAQITARAMAKGANVDKLAAEFASELEALGVKVAALEKNADNFKIAGYVRYAYVAQSGDLADNSKTLNGSYLRTRLTFNGQINDDWSFTGMLAQDSKNLQANADTESVVLQRSYVNGKIGGVNVLAGRYQPTLGGGNLYDNRANGIELSYGKAIKVTGRYGKLTAVNKDAVAAVSAKDADGKEVGLVSKAVDAINVKYAGAQVTAKAGIVDLDAQYTKFYDVESGNEGVAIWSVQAGLPVAKDVKVDAIYLKANTDDKNKGVVATVSYKGASAAKPGSWGIYAKYYNQDFNTYIKHTMNGNVNDGLTDGFKGFMVGGRYAVAKNMTVGVEYYGLKDKTTDASNNTLWTDLVFTF